MLMAKYFSTAAILHPSSKLLYLNAHLNEAIGNDL
jgi:hypothetical protein